MIRGGDILEAASRVDTVVFDKTGTLTAGRPSVTSVVMQQAAMSEHDVLMLAAAVEQQTNHPIAKAIVRRANSTGAVYEAWLLGSSLYICSQPYVVRPHDYAVKAQWLVHCHHTKCNAGLPPVEDGTLEQEPGSGVRGIVSGTAVSVGTLEWVSRHSSREGESANAAANGPAVVSAVSTSQPDASQPLHHQQHQQVSRLTRVYVGINGSVAAYIDVVDNLRFGAAATIAGLRSMGITSVLLSGKYAIMQRHGCGTAACACSRVPELDMLLAGDQEGPAKAVAAAVGIDPEHVHAGVKPAGKAAMIKQLQSVGRRVAMVGDGANDAAALAQVNVFRDLMLRLPQFLGPCICPPR